MKPCSLDEIALSQRLQGELSPEEADAIDAHVASCPTCAQRREALARLDDAIDALPRPSLAPGRAQAILQNIKRASTPPRTSKTAPETSSEIMTMDEVASFLHVDREDLDGELLDGGLPVFEFAGRLRMRRTRLLAWIEEREKQREQRRLFTIVTNELNGLGS